MFLRKLLILVAISISFSSLGWAAQVPFHKVLATKNESIKQFLKRFDLDSNDCSFKQFLKLNKLVSTSKIKEKATYQLPIYLYDFDGKSIRTSVKIDDWKTASRIDKYNKTLLKKGIRNKSIAESKIIWVPYHDLSCKDLTEEKNLKARIYPIFGKKYEKVPLLSNKLKGKVYYIDSGHGGPDPGANTKHNGKRLCEDEYSYDIALRLVQLLVQHGAIAYMVTRDPNDGIRDDMYLKPDSDEASFDGDPLPINQKLRLAQRCEIVNRLYRKHKKQGVKSQQQVIIHIDSRSKKAQTDVFFYHKKSCKDGECIAEDMCKTLRMKYKEAQPNRGYDGTVSARGLYQLNASLPHSVYIELGNIKHPLDQERILYKENRQALAKWLFEGLTAKNSSK